MLDGMTMQQIGEQHAQLHAKLYGKYRPATPDDPWFAASEPGYCLAGWYQAYLKAYRASCTELGITLGAIADCAYGRYGMKPASLH
jgi:hypothetical protein